jgi:hypothetical protein
MIKRKIIARVYGGIGNQLFIYSAARRLSLINQAELVLDTQSGFAVDFKYQRKFHLDKFNINARIATPEERFEPLSKYRRYLKRNINKLKPFANRSFIVQSGNDFDSRLLGKKVKSVLYLEGSWQSENYFLDFQDTIRRELEIKPPNDVLNLKHKREIDEANSVAIHVRFFDDPSKPSKHNVPFSYYKSAIEKINSIVPNPKYFVFTDKPVQVRETGLLQDLEVTYIENNNSEKLAYADLWLMSNCKHFIIANSTFSWWGAWLSNNKRKKVIAPDFKIIEKNRITSWGFEGLIPRNWIKIPV